MHRAFASAALLICAAAAAYTQNADSPTLRLPDTVVPREYRAELRIVPGENQFEGKIQIDIDVKRETPVVWLLARDLKFGKVTVGGAAATVTTGSYDFVGLRTETPVPQGPTTVNIEYTGVVSRVLTDGVFQQQERSDWYVFTKFEPVTARRAFPSFDEPSYKTPWKLTLRVPAGLRVFSNTPQEGPDEALEGRMKVVKFARTKPLPTYLIAFAIGPFDVVETPPAGKRAVSSRIVVPRGRQAEAAFAAAHTPEAVTRLEEYFGIPYPYEKLDQIVVPVTTAWGAMENAGLIAYGQFLLMRPGENTRSRQQGILSVILHEVAHQWFGNMVTMPWWDDIWLNEGFASWVQGKVLDRWHPEWRVAEEAAAGGNNAKSADVLLASRRVRQPIRTPADIGLAFDGMTYSKGSALLRMFDNAIGPDTFRAGIRAHLDSRAWGSGSTNDLLASISNASRKDVTSSFSSFLDQTGLPLVEADLRCEKSTVILDLKQQPFVPLGQTASRNEVWNIPVCVRWQDGRQCVQLTGPKASFELKTKGCPTWFYANENGAGYYRVQQTARWTSRLTERASTLTNAESATLLQDLDALVAAGRFDAGDALRLAQQFASAESPTVVSAALATARRIDRSVPEDLQTPWQQFLGEWLGPRARQLGWEPQPSDSEDRKRIRSMLVPFVAAESADADLMASARVVADRYLASRTSVDGEMGPAALRVAAQFGDRVLFNRLVNEMRAASAQGQRLEILAALGGFHDAKLMAEALELILRKDSGIDPRESARLLGFVNPQTRDVLWSFIRSHFDQLNSVLPGARGIPFGSTLPLAVAGFCESQRADEVESFFRPLTGANPGMERNLNRSTEGIRQCAAQRSWLENGLRKYLEEVRSRRAFQGVATQG